MQNVDRQTIELILIAIGAVAVVVQTIALIVLTAAMVKAGRAAHEEIQELRSSIMPIVYNTRDILTRVAPKIEEAANELSALTRSLRDQTADVQAAAAEAIGRAQRTAARLDAMANTVLDNVERAAEFVSVTVARPVRQVSGVVASVKAIVESLRNTAQS